jgi:ketosteroid isomerase-like protein
MENKSNDRQALEDINKLHEKDIAASKERNFELLRTLNSDQAIILPPGSNPIQGKSGIDNGLSQMRESTQDDEILEYIMEFQDIQVQGNYAFEWGFSHGAMRNTRTGEIQKVTYRLFRVLRRENNQWKVYRSIWNQ